MIKKFLTPCRTLYFSEKPWTFAFVRAPGIYSGNIEMELELSSVLESGKWHVRFPGSIRTFYPFLIFIFFLLLPSPPLTLSVSLALSFLFTLLGHRKCEIHFSLGRHALKQYTYGHWPWHV